MTDLNQDAIAIVGISCRLPQAKNVDEFWTLLTEGRNAITEVPPDRWNIDDYYHPEPAKPGKMVTRWGGFLPNIDFFDPEFFGISPREAERMDPQQRLTLELAWEALENAGMAPQELKGTETGVFLGIGNHDYTRELCADLDAITTHNGIGGTLSIAANRVSYFLDLRGPSLGIESACSSSLVAVHLACQSLRTGEITMALVGGVNAVLTPDMTIAFSQARMMSPTGACRAFDAGADGYVRSEGGGMLVLKPYITARKHGDRIIALIRGSAINQDGTTNGITAPCGRAQREVIKAACKRAAISPANIGYIEAHGTGTVVGDPIEFNALRAVLLPERQPNQVCWIGAVKTNIGHLEAGAGIAGIIKTVLALQNKTIPPNLHLSSLNPSIRLTSGKLALPNQCEPWSPINNTRLAGVSSFSFGGNNCHVILEETPGPLPCATGEHLPGNSGAILFTFSAKTANALKDLISLHMDYLCKEQTVSLRDIGYTLGKGRDHWSHRLAIVADSTQVLCGHLEAWRNEQPHPAVVHQVINSRRAPEVTFVLTDPGEPLADIACNLYDSCATFRRHLDRCNGAFHSLLHHSIEDLMHHHTAGSQGALPANLAQPLWFSMQYALAQTWFSLKIHPKSLIGIGLGEYVAACLAGVFSFGDALKLVALRAHLPQANTNENVGVKLTQGMLSEFYSTAKTINYRAPGIALFSDMQGKLWSPDEIPDADYWCRHLSVSTSITNGLRYLAEQGISIFLEIGFGQTLMDTDNQQRLLADATYISCFQESNLGWSGIVNTLAVLYSKGINPNWREFYGEHAAPVPLPTYPFQRKSHWHTARAIGSKSDAQTEYPQLTAINIHNLRESARAARYKEGSDKSATPQATNPHLGLAGMQSSELQRILTDLVAATLHMESSHIEESTPFLELGADSLVLVDFLHKLEASFGVKITLRQLFNDLSSIDLLATHIQRTVPFTNPTAANNSFPASEGVELKHTNTQANEIVATGPANSKHTQHVTSPIILSQQQQHYLHQFVPAYCQHTATSKQRAQQSRVYMADSRASAGFRPSIKEMLYPIVGERAEGAYFWDIDNNRYLDISMGFGVLLLGHQPECVVTAIQRQLGKGLFIGPQANMADEVAELICQLTDVERVGFCNSGTEAAMTALRLARTATKKDKIVIFANSYHGHFDGVLASAQGKPSSAGIPVEMAKSVYVLNYDNQDSLTFIEQHRDDLAAVLVEPVQSRYPGLQPADFLQQLRTITQRHGIVLIFDEVLTGFRIQLGGAQAWFDIRADIVTYGKIVGGGLPIGIVAGRRQFLDSIDGGAWFYGDDSMPVAPTAFFAGTFNKNHLGMAAAGAILRYLQAQGPALYRQLNQLTAAMAEELNQLFEEERVPVSVVYFGSLFRFQFSGNLDIFFYHLLKKGIYIWEGRTCFLSTAHTASDITFLIQCVRETIREMKQGGWFTDQQSILLQTQPEPTVRLPSSLVNSSISKSMDKVRKALHYHRADMQRYIEGMVQLNHLALMYAQHALTPDGHNREQGSFADINELTKLLSISSEHQRLVDRFIYLLRDNDAFSSDGRRYSYLAKETSEVLRNDIAQKFPELTPELDMVDRCGQALPEVITGARHPISVLFPNGDLQALTRIYADSIMSRSMNELTRTALTALIEQVQSDRPVRILELGAGTGGTTDYLLPALEKLPFPEIRYTFSDISELFLHQAKQRYQAYDFVDYQLLDIEKSVSAGNYDIVIAANVLHATKDIAATVQNTSRWLAPGGVLLLLEITKAAPWLDLVFGITTGWWYFNDSKVRTTGPLLEATQWKNCLYQNGFDHVSTIASDEAIARAEKENNAQQTLFIARVQHCLELSENQRGMLTLSCMTDNASLAYNLNVKLEFLGDLSVSILRNAIRCLYQRNEALRIVFHKDGEWQKVKNMDDLKFDLPCLKLTELEAEQRLLRWGGQVFDLSKGPLVKFRLIQLDLQRHWLILTAHHLVLDGQSVATLVEQLLQTYQSLQSKETTISWGWQSGIRQFSDYLADERQKRDTHYPENEQYWLSVLPKPIPVINLPLDRQRPPVQTYRGKRVKQQLNSDIIIKLKNISAREGCTLFMTLLTAFELLIYRISKTELGLIGISSAGQNAFGDSKIVGSCVNVLALPFYIQPEARVVELLAEVKERLLDAYAHQEYSFSRLVKKLGLQRNPERAALVDVHFNYDKNQHMPPLAGLTVNMDSYLAGAVRRDITWNIVETGNKLWVICDYNSDLFNEYTIVTWILKYQSILHNLLQQSSFSVAGLIALCEKTERDETEKRNHHMKQTAENRLKRIKRQEKYIDN